MGQDSKIEWTKHTGNIWIGCTEVHEGCDHCYARVLNHRWGKSNWGIDVPRQEVKSFFKNILMWNKLAKEANRIDSVFIGSMMDIAEKSMPVINSKGELQDYATGELREKFYLEIVPQCQNLFFLLLSKRPSNYNKQIPGTWKENPPLNVMFGTSPVNQETADKLIPQLLEVKGKRFLSVEPCLSEVNLIDYLPNIDWVIVGGESGHHKRPFNASWARFIRNDCQVTRTPFFMKQMDKIQPIPDDLMIREFPKFELA